MSARFYAGGAPSWWPYQLVSAGSGRLPPRRGPGFYRLIVDNGMFRYYSRSKMPPSLGEWYRRLHVFLADVDRLRKPAEIVAVLPDWITVPEYGVESVSSEYAARLCTRYRCMAVVHASGGLSAYSYYAELIVEAAMSSGVNLYALGAPLKLNCSRLTRNARRTRLECQAAVVEQVCRVARKHGLRCHGLGVVLSPSHVKRLVDLGLDSFDSTSWTRPNANIGMNWSAKNRAERERLFRLVLERLAAEVEIEGTEVLDHATDG